MRHTHFGPGGRKRGSQIRPPDTVLQSFEDNPYLKQLTSDAIEYFATQGDGNHFFYVGRLVSTGEVALVTHHGSRPTRCHAVQSGNGHGSEIPPTPIARNTTPQRLDSRR